MSDEVKKYLHDIYTAILQIEEYLCSYILTTILTIHEFGK
jgi:hypothetical protein